MSRSPFGYWYPAGAENDPNAPYNQQGGDGECAECGEKTSDEDGAPYHPSEPEFCSLRCENAWRRKNECDEDAAYEQQRERQGEESEK